jgi:hypothetical protein
MRRIPLLLFICLTLTSSAQVDSIARAITDSLKTLLIDDEIPKRTFGDLFMYPHRWYVKQLLKPRQPSYDTSYITTHRKKLNISAAVAKKFYGFSVLDKELGPAYKFQPNTPYHVGFNFSNIIATFGFYPGIHFGSDRNRGSTSARDFQVMFVGTRVITDINYQRYKGMFGFPSRSENVNQFNSPLFTVRPDINVFSFTVNTWYVFNHRKFSLRGAFSFSDIQKKSAGSFMLGLYHSYLLFSSFDSTLLLTPDKKEFSTSLHDIRDVNHITVGLSTGFGYTYVYRHWLLSHALTVGAGLQKTNYSVIEGHGRSLPLNAAFNVNFKGSLRYDRKSYFTGIQFVYNNNYALNSRMFNTENYLGKFLLFAGYRFDLQGKGRKLLKKVGLVDYKKAGK